jgi:hypothetical protein
MTEHMYMVERKWRYKGFVSFSRDRRLRCTCGVVTAWYPRDYHLRLGKRYMDYLHIVMAHEEQKEGKTIG